MKHSNGKYIRDFNFRYFSLIIFQFSNVVIQNYLNVWEEYHLWSCVTLRVQIVRIPLNSVQMCICAQFTHTHAGQKLCTYSMVRTR